MNIGVIGFGNLGKALVQGILHKNIVTKNNIYVCAKSEKTLSLSKNEYGVNSTSDINYILSKSDIIFFVIKEKIFNEITSSIDKQYLENKTIVSFMAGVSLENLRKRLGIHLNIIRAMPSIAIANGNGVIGYTNPNGDSFSINIFENLGFAIEITEKDIEKITAFSACGLGFASYIINGFVQAGVKLGFSEEISEKIVANNFLNSIDMSNFQDTVSAVATKGGATEQGIKLFDENNVNEIITAAIIKAYEKVNK